MRLQDFLPYGQIVIQCHDNPDADAVASGFGVYTYLKNQGKQVRLIYGGSHLISRSNLLMMVSELEIPIEHVDTLEPPDLLITVDCQYREGNVTFFEAKEEAVIDHHQVSGELPDLHLVRSNLASCSTIIWGLLQQEGVNLREDRRLSTALYYGLLMDTNNFTEVFHPLDKDLRDDAWVDRDLIVRLRCANLTMEELKIAGTALLHYDYDETYRYAVVMAAPCDPTILGMIGDFIMGVDAVDACLVYNVQSFGIKISVRSCIRENKASEIAKYVTRDVGSGGGHVEKAGGFIQTELLRAVCGYTGTESDVGDFLRERMQDFYEDIEIIHAENYVRDLSRIKVYRKKAPMLGLVRLDDILSVGAQIHIRTMEGDMDVQVQEKHCLVIGTEGEITVLSEDAFVRNFKLREEAYAFEGSYEPMMKGTADSDKASLIPMARACTYKDEVKVYARPLTRRVKLFTEDNREKYVLGNEGDYLTVHVEDLQKAYIIERSEFLKDYEEIKCC